jgi:hypothetical protein
VEGEALVGEGRVGGRQLLEGYLEGAEGERRVSQHLLPDAQPLGRLDDVREADQLREADRRHVDRMLEGDAKRHDPAELPVVVSGTVGRRLGSMTIEIGPSKIVSEGV